MRLVSAEFLKLRRRTGLVLAALGLTIVPAVIMLLVTGGGDADTGGVRTFADQVGVIASLTIVAGILVGATVGTADVASGVFRDLVVTGRSRIDLYTARVPAALALVLAGAIAGLAIVALSAIGSAGSAPTQAVHGLEELGTVAPGIGLIVKAALWLAVVAASSFALALGVSSLVGSVGGSIATLLAFWLVITPLVQSFDSLDWLRNGLVVSALEKILPTGLTGGDPSLELSVAAAVAVIAAWTAIPLLAGAWRTVTRDA